MRGLGLVAAIMGLALLAGCSDKAAPATPTAPQDLVVPTIQPEPDQPVVVPPPLPVNVTIPVVRLDLPDILFGLAEDAAFAVDIDAPQPWQVTATSWTPNATVQPAPAYALVLRDVGNGLPTTCGTLPKTLMTYSSRLDAALGWPKLPAGHYRLQVWNPSGAPIRLAVGDSATRETADRQLAGLANNGSAVLRPYVETTQGPPAGMSFDEGLKVASPAVFLGRLDPSATAWPVGSHAETAIQGTVTGTCARSSNIAAPTAPLGPSWSDVRAYLPGGSYAWRGHAEAPSFALAPPHADGDIILLA